MSIYEIIQNIISEYPDIDECYIRSILISDYDYDTYIITCEITW